MSLDLLGELVVGHRLELGAVDDAVGVEQADLGGDGPGGQRVVAGDHRDVDAGAVALGDGVAAPPSRGGSTRPRMPT